MKTKKVLLIIFASLILELLVIPLRGISFALATASSLLLYFGLTYFFLAKYKESLKAGLIVLLIMLGSIPTNLVHIIYFLDTLVSLPNWIYELLGVGLGYCCFISKNNFMRIAIIVIAVTVSLLGYFYYDCWLEYVRGLDYFKNVNCY